MVVEQVGLPRAEVEMAGLPRAGLGPVAAEALVVPAGHRAAINPAIAAPAAAARTMASVRW